MTKAAPSTAEKSDPLDVVRGLAAQSAEPIGFNVIVKAVGDESSAQATVERLLRNRELFEVAAKGKVRRFVLVDPLPEFVEAIAELTTEPTTVEAVAKRLAKKSPQAPGVTRIAEHLESEVAACRLFRVGVDDGEPPNIVYCRSTAWQRIERAALATSKPIAPKALVKATSVPESQIAACLDALVDDGVLYLHPGAKTASKRYFKEAPIAKRRRTQASLAESVRRLVDALESQKKSGGANYPSTFAKLAALTELPTEAAAKVEKKFLADKRIAALVGQVMFAEDAETAVAKPEVAAKLLVGVFAKMRTDERCGFTVAELAAGCGAPQSLRSRLTASMTEVVRGGKSTGLAWVEMQSGPVVFRPTDVRGMSAAPNPPQLGVADFVREFPATFDRLDAKSGRHNFVSLVALRRELARYTRADFDAGLKRLCEDRRFWVEPAAGGVSAEEQNAGILEGGRLLLFVKRRREGEN